MQILSLAIWILLIVLNAFTDAKRNKAGKSILLKYHLASWIIRYMVAFLLITFVHYLGHVPYVDDIEAGFFKRVWHAVWANREVWGLLTAYGMWSWLIFDLTYNISRGLPLGYVGKSSWLDRIFRFLSNPTLFQYLAKVLLGIIAVILMLV